MKWLKIGVCGLLATATSICEHCAITGSQRVLSTVNSAICTVWISATTFALGYLKVGALPGQDLVDGLQVDEADRQQPPVRDGQRLGLGRSAARPSSRASSR